MRFSGLLFAATAFVASVSAQYYSTSGPIAIDPSQIDPSTRAGWCNNQLTNCPTICGGTTANNTCDSTTLVYNCTCTSSPQPNITAYQNTIPWFECTQWITNCANANSGSFAAVQACHSVVCGTEDASPNATSSTGSSSSTSSASTTTMASTNAASSPTGSSTTSSATQSPTGAAMRVAAVNFGGSAYGSGAFVAGLLAVFGLAL